MNETKRGVRMHKSPALILNALLRSLRPKQWGKNVFVFTGIFFSKKHLLLQPNPVIRTVLAFALFCLISSSIYLINDVVDKKSDQHHPLKRFRPIASGDLQPWIAIVLSVILLMICVGSVLLLVQDSESFDKGWFHFGVVLATYYILQLAYSFVLKQIVFIDLFVITTGFVLRAIGGALVISVYMTPWWLLCIFFLALFLGLSKRRDELILFANRAGGTRRTLQEYSPGLLDQLLTIDVACIIIMYSQATFTAPLALSLPFPFLMITVPFVVYALFRYLYLILQKGKRGEPVEIILGDRPLVFTIAIWGVMVILIQSIEL